MSHEVLTNILTVVLIMAVFFAVLLALLGVGVVVIAHKAKKRLRRINNTVNGDPTFEMFDILKAREQLTDDEVIQVRDWLKRNNKEMNRVR